jgi:hypothetical protein
MAKSGEEHLPIKQAEKPVKVIRYDTPEEMSDIKDLFFYRVTTTGSSEYCMYVFQTQKIVMHYLDRKSAAITVL